MGPIAFLKLLEILDMRGPLIYNKKMTTELLYAYLAGIIDGEAFVGFVKRPKRHSFVFCIGVEMTDYSIPKLLQETFGGSLRPRDRRHQPGRENHKPTWIWRVSHRKARTVYRKVEPYLRLKAGKLPLSTQQLISPS